MYSTPEALPADLHDRAYSAEPPVGQPGTTLGGNVGPLRGSHTSIRGTKKSAQPPVLVTTAADSIMGPNGFFSSMAQMLSAYAQNAHVQPQQQQPQITMTTPKPQLALQDVAASAQQSSPPRAETAHGDLASPAASANEPLTPKMQAEAMLAAWDMRSEQRKAEQTAQEDDGNNDNQKDEKGAGGKKVVPKKKPAGKIPQGAGIMKKPAATAKDTKNGMVKSKEPRGPKLTRKQKDYYAKRPLSERITVRPNGCCKCRGKPGCCPSCFA